MLRFFGVIAAIVVFSAFVPTTYAGEDRGFPFGPEGTWYGTNAFGQTFLCTFTPLGQPNHWSGTCTGVSNPSPFSGNIALASDWVGELVRVRPGVYTLTQMVYYAGLSTDEFGWPLPYGSAVLFGTGTMTSATTIEFVMPTINFYPALPLGCGDDPEVDCVEFQDPWDPVFSVPLPPGTNVMKRMPSGVAPE